jgi:hypothetical protein
MSTQDEELRLQRIEAALAEHAIAIDNLAPKQQLSHILALVQRQIEEMRTDIASIKSQLKAIKK